MHEKSTPGAAPARRADTLDRGCLVLCEAVLYRVELLVDFESVVASEVETGRARVLPIASLSIPDHPHEAARARQQPMDALDEKDWKIAFERLEAIRPLLEGERSRCSDVARRACEVGCTANTLYTWMARYRATSDVTSLVPMRRGWRKGRSRIPSETEAVIADAIDRVYLQRDRRSAMKVVLEVRNVCRKRGIDPPSEPTIRARIAKIPEQERLRRRGWPEAARRRFTPTPGQFPGAHYPLAYVQIDHTMVDLVVVDDVHRQPIGRPWITLAADVYSRMVTGLYLSLDAPSQISVAMCVAQSVLTKEEVLLHAGVDAEWPVWGWPTVIHVDNGPDFRAKEFRKTCARYGVRIEFRPVKRPHYGAHIERLLGTLMKEIHDLPGTTFSSVEQRGEHDPDRDAAFTLAELERWLIGLVCNVYHLRTHRTLGTSPRQQWDLGVFGTKTTPGAGLPRRPDRAADITRDFLPAFERTVQPTGVTIEGMRYYAGALRHWINATDPNGSGRKRKLRFRRDPRDISRVWFFDPLLKEYFDVPAADQSLPAVSLWEYREARRRLHAEGKASTHPHELGQAIEDLRAQAEQAQQRSRKARRKVQRRRTHEAAQETTGARNQHTEPAEAPGDTDMSYEPVMPFGAIE